MRIRLAMLMAFMAWLALGPTLGLGVARAQEGRLLGQVLTVIDGGTLRVRLDGGSVEMVRLRGVTVPATASSTSTAGCFGPEAAARLALLAPAGSAVELDVEAPERDADGHLLAYVWRKDALLMVNEQLLAEGYAMVPPTLADDYMEQFTHAQEVARSHNLGIWRACPDNLPEPSDNAASTG
jgi:micrococcal nuclease